MIRTASIQFKADKTVMMIQLGWDDPDKEFLRTNMAKWVVEGLKRFQERCKIVGGTFDVEMMCKFFKELPADRGGDRLALIIIADGTNGWGVEWRKPALVVSEVADSQVSQVNLSALRDRAMGANQGD
jgi:hypothetical protein